MSAEIYVPIDEINRREMERTLGVLEAAALMRLRNELNQPTPPSSDALEVA